MKKILITLVPLTLGLLLAWSINLPKDGFFIKDMHKSMGLIFVVNCIICLIILYGNQLLADIVYVYNLFFMGMVIYIMLFIMNNIIYYHAPIEIGTFIYTYVYARDKNKKLQVFIIAFMILLAAIIEGILI